MEGIMASERPSYLLEQQYPYPSLRRSIWSAYGTYRSFAHARAKAARLNRPCQISEYRVIWRSVPIRQTGTGPEKIGPAPPPFRRWRGAFSRTRMTEIGRATRRERVGQYG